MADTSIKCPICREDTKFLTRLFVKTNCNICFEDCDIMCSLICGHCLCEECSTKIGLYKPKEKQLSMKVLVSVVDEIGKQEKELYDKSKYLLISKVEHFKWLEEIKEFELRTPGTKYYKEQIELMENELNSIEMSMKESEYEHERTISSIFNGETIPPLFDNIDDGEDTIDVD